MREWTGSGDNLILDYSREMESGRDGGEVNGDVKETPSSVVNTSKSEEPRDERQLQQHVANMGKQNDEDLDEGAQERMLQGDDGNAKITEKDNIEVNEDATTRELATRRNNMKI